MRILTACLFLTTGFSARSQYYQLANQLPKLITPALSGSLNYKGFVDASYLQGLGNKKIDVINVSTSQGFKYANWFYMGVGLGLDIVKSHTGPNYGTLWTSPYRPESYSTTGVMLPVFTDFRFNVGGPTSASFFADIRLGASFLMSNAYLAVGDGYITNREYFYLRPSVGVRIPLDKNVGKKAIDIGVTYQLITTNYWYNSIGNTTINSLGGTVAFEW